MSIDTENKRRSVLAQCVPQLVVYQTPDGTIDSYDRRHISRFYSGITTTIDMFFFWRKDQDASHSSAWSSDGNGSLLWKKDNDSSTAWVNVPDHDEE